MQVSKVFFNKDGEGDVVQSSTFNLTRITTWLALAIGGVTTVQASRAEEKTGQGGEIEWIDPLKFNDDQRLVIIIALIAAVAIVHAADLIARSLATSRAVSSQVNLLPTMRKAQKKVPGPGNSPVTGRVAAIRSADGALLFYTPDDDQNPGEWVPLAHITFVD